jgi:hypothetical protein
MGEDEIQLDRVPHENPDVQAAKPVAFEVR